MSRFASEVGSLRSRFQDVGSRAPWVGACVAVRPGQVWAFGIGRSGTANYAINRVWQYDHRPVPELAGRSGAVGRGDGINHPVYSELVNLTSRAGTLLQKMCAAGTYTLRLFPSSTLPYRLDDPIQSWLVFLLHSLATCGHCTATERGGIIVAAGQIPDAETTLAWIDEYPGVCLAGLTELEAALEASAPATPREDGGGQPLREPPAHAARVARQPTADPICPNSDFTMVKWGDVEYRFSLGIQSSAVRVLFEEWKKTGMGLHQQTIRQSIDDERDSFRMDNAFRGHPALGTMIQSRGDGRYQLVAPGSRRTPQAKKTKKSAGITPKSREKRV